MPFKVQVGPPQIAIHQGETVLVSEPDDQINWPSDKGLNFPGTRIVSSWAIYANGEPWELLNVPRERSFRLSSDARSIAPSRAGGRPKAIKLKRSTLSEELGRDLPRFGGICRH